MKRNKNILIAMAFLAAATSSYGTIFWQNLGNTSAYNFSNALDMVQGVSSPSYIGPLGSIEARCNFLTNGVRYHSEWTPVGTWNQGTNPTAYFGYAIYLPTNFQFTSLRAVTEQYGTRLAGGGTIKPDWYQAWIGGGTASAYQFSAINSSDETSGTMTVGAWHTVVTKVTFGTNGNVTVWFDGNQAWSQNGTINGGGSGNTNGLWALGLYEADWDGSNPGNATNVTVYGAAATIATTYAEANPATYATVPKFSGEYQIQCVASGLSLNVSGAATTNGAPIIQYSYSGSSNELWTFIPTTNGYYQILNMNSGLDMAVQGASTANGAKIIQWSFGSSGDDQWEPVPNSDGSYTFYNLNSGMVLDDPGSSTSSGTQFDQWPANAGANQKFNVTYITSEPSPIWNGHVNGNWDTSTANWQGGLTYQQGELVTFNDTAAGTTNVILTTTLSPGSLTVSNATKTYTFNGSGSISGSAGLVKAGTGTATFAETGGDTFTGGITMNGGTLTYAAAGSFNGGVTNNAGTLILDQPEFCYGSATNAGGATIQVGNNDTNGWLPSGNVANNGSLVFDQTTNATVSNSISGTGTLTQNDTNNLTLSGASTYTGQTIINANGTLSISAENNLGANPSSFVNNQLYIDGGTLEVTAATTLNNANRGIKIDNTLGGSVAVDTGFSATIGNVITGGTLTKTGGGTLALTNGASTFTNVIVNGQTLRDNNVPALGIGSVTVSNGAELYLNAVGAYKNPSINIIGYGVSEGDTANTHLGAIRFATAGVILSSNVTLIGDAGISPRGTGTTGATIAGQITGPHNIRFGRVATSSGTSFGTLILSNVTANANNWTGNTTNMDGTLKLGAANQIPSGASYGNFIMSTPGAAFVTSGNALTNTVFDLNGNNQTVNGLSHDPNVTGSGLNLLLITNSSATAATLTVGAGNSNGIYAGLIAGSSLKLSKIGTGTEIFPGNNVYTGTTTISNGTLEVDGSLAAGSAVTVAAAGTLSGIGTIGGTVVVNGTIAPGSPSVIGTLTCLSTVTNNGTVFMKLNKTNSPSTNDLFVANTISYGGTLTVTNLGPALVAGDSFQLFNAGSSSGSFNVTNLPPLSAGLAWTNNSSGIWSVVNAATPLSNLGINGFSLTGGTNLVINGTNLGAGTYYVLASTNAALPLTNWTAIATDTVSGSGNFTFTATNAVNAGGVSQQFYILSTTNN